MTAYLDHLAVAAESWDELWPRYRVELGGEWVSGELGFGFSPAQVRYANGMKVEVLSPEGWEQNDFLRRFLDRRGPGPHHVTFKVPDILEAIDTVRAAGYEPVGIDLRDAHWKEAFLHPKDAPGIVVQLAEAPHEWDSPPPADMPDAAGEQATFDYLALAVADVGRAHALFAGLLDGEETCHGRDDVYDADWIELGWKKGGGRIRLIDLSLAGDDVRAWVGAESGRLHHAAFTVAGAADLADAKPLGDGRYEVAAEANLGVRLVISER